MDSLRALILFVYGGVFFDNDYVLINSPQYLHSTLDFYSSYQSPDLLMDLKHGNIVASRPKHLIMHTQLQLIFELNGQIFDLYGVYDIIPSPMTCVDYILMHGPRFWMVAAYTGNNQNGNNDAFFKPTMLLKDSQQADPEHPDNWEYITVNGKKVRIDRIGYQTPSANDYEWRQKCHDKKTDLHFIFDPTENINQLSLVPYNTDRHVQRELKMNANEIAIQGLYGCFLKQEIARSENAIKASSKQEL